MSDEPKSQAHDAPIHAPVKAVITFDPNTGSVKVDGPQQALLLTWMLSRASVIVCENVQRALAAQKAEEPRVQVASASSLNGANRMRAL